MIALLWLILVALASPLKSKCQLELENVALRHQVMVVCTENLCVLKTSSRNDSSIGSGNSLFVCQDSLFHQNNSLFCCVGNFAASL